MLKPTHPRRHDPHVPHVTDDHTHEVPLPPDLMAQATAKHPKDAKKRQARYVELMTEHGHIQPADE